MLPHGMLGSAEAVTSPRCPVLKKAIQILEHVWRGRVGENRSGTKRSGPPLHRALEPAHQASSAQSVHGARDCAVFAGPLVVEFAVVQRGLDFFRLERRAEKWREVMPVTPLTARAAPTATPPLPGFTGTKTCAKWPVCGRRC